MQRPPTQVNEIATALTLQVPTPQNNQTHFNNSSAKALFECV